jgi:transposase
MRVIELDIHRAFAEAVAWDDGKLKRLGRWIPDERTQALRRQVTRRNQIVRQRSRLKNIIQSILHSHLIPSCPRADLWGASGRAWLFHQVLPEDERLAIERHLREFHRLGDDLKVIERDLARSALGDEGVKRLMTIPGVDMVVALAIVNAIGDVGRFEQSQKLVSYLCLNPSVRQSGPGPAYHGRITKQGRGHARGMLSSRRLGRQRERRVRRVRSSCCRRRTYPGRRNSPDIRSRTRHAPPFRS